MVASNIPMNPQAQVTAVKAAVPFQDLPLADEGGGMLMRLRARVAKWVGRAG